MDQALTRQESLEEGRGDVAFLEVGVVEDAAVERDGGLVLLMMDLCGAPVREIRCAEPCPWQA